MKRPHQLLTHGPMPLLQGKNQRRLPHLVSHVDIASVDEMPPDLVNLPLGSCLECVDLASLRLFILVNRWASLLMGRRVLDFSCSERMR